MMILENTISQTLSAVSRDALELILDASIYEEHLTIVIDPTDDWDLGDETHRTLIACGARTDEDGAYQFATLEEITQLMDQVSQLLDGAETAEPSSDGVENQQLNEEGFIVFDDVPWDVLAALPTESSEALQLEFKGYALRRFPVSSIRVKPANNPRSRTTRAGIVRLARNIAKRGLQQPVTVRPDPLNEDEFELVFGYRRMAAISYAILQGWLPEDWDVICIVRKLNDSQVRLAALSENEEREEVDALDQAQGWAKLRMTQTESSIADAAGVSLTAVKRCLKVAFGVCEEAKALYRDGKLVWNALIAFSYGSLEAQRAYLKAAGDTSWKLGAEQVRMAMSATDFKLVNARFTLEEYEAAGGQFETDLWNSAEGTRLLSQDVIERLQTAWAEGQLEAMKSKGLAFVELRRGDWAWWSEFNRVPRDCAEAGAVVHIRSDWGVDVIEGVVPNQVSTSSGGTNGQVGMGASATITKPEAPKAAYSEAGVTLVRRLRTAALQQGILENCDAKLPLTLAILGFLGEREVRFTIKPLGETDAIVSSVILTELEAFAARLPNVSISPTRGLEFTLYDAIRSLETFASLLAFSKSDLERLHRLLVATMIGDFAAATDGNALERRRTLKVNPLIGGLAAHLRVKGGEAWEASEDYLKAISYRKAKLEPYLAAAVGEMLARALMDNPKAKIIAEMMAQKAKISAGFTPPELEFSQHGSVHGITLEAHADDFADDEAPLETSEDLISENDLDFDPRDETDFEAAAD
jgi:ParB/RepB/Spo0J family partition protein